MEPNPLFLLFLLTLLSSSTITTTSSLSTPISPTKSPSAPTPTKAPSAPTPTKSTSAPTPTKSPTAPTPTKSPSPPSSPSSPSTLDPKQLRALQSLNIPTSKDPCSSLHNTTRCDSSKPFRHLLSLHLTNCSDDVALSITALKSLSTLQDLQFINCPISPVHFPTELVSNLRSFTCINSLRRLTGVWLARLQNLTDLTVSGVTVNASGPLIIIGNLSKLRSVTISHTNLTGYLPKKWHPNITHIDFSGNQLKGKIPTSLTRLESLESLNLSSNSLTGEIPTSIGDLLSLQNVSFSSNSLSGQLPDSMSALIPSLVHIDLSSNQFNGTIPRFISEMKKLKYLNLENNEFHGMMPFNGSFIKKLVVFKVGGNSNLCYNHSTISSKVKLGIAPCDKHGLPLSPPPAPESSSEDDTDSSSSSDNDGSTEDGSNKKNEHSHGPSKIVLGVAIGLSSIVFLIVFLVLLSKWCG